MTEAGPRNAGLAVADPDAGGGLAERIQALFKEAHRRRQRRRLAYVLIAAVSVIAVVLGLATGWPRDRDQLARHGDARPTGMGAPGFTLPPATVAWVDYGGRVHVGDVRRMVSGTGVFASPDGRQLYVVQDDTSLLELPASGTGAARRLTLPSGWYVDPPDQAVAGGVVVVSRPGRPARPWNLAVWNPGRGGVRIIGRGGAAEVMAAYTPPGARYSLLAWQPAACPSGDCPIEITNTATTATVTFRSPLHRGFTTIGAAFSPDGTHLAVFARTASLDPLHYGSELVLLSIGTGAARLVTGVQLDTPEDAGWVLWLPGGTRLLAGALDYSYAVDTATYAARPFFFFPGNSDHDIMDTPDVNFSVTLLAGSG
jgi:hypothetical protein